MDTPDDFIYIIHFQFRFRFYHGGGIITPTVTLECFGDMSQYILMWVNPTTNKWESKICEPNYN